MNHIKLITFDLDDTLWSVEKVIKHANGTMYQWLVDSVAGFAERFPLDELKRYAASHSAEHPELDDFVTQKRKLLLESVIGECGAKPALRSRLSADAFQVFYDARQRVEFYPDVLPTLQHLAEHYTLCALSNGNADIFRTAAGPYFSGSISAESCGVAKPDARIFQAALQQFSVSAEDTLHVGDHIETDVVGAMQAGLHAVWVNYAREPWPDEFPTPSACIEDFSALPKVLRT